MIIIINIPGSTLRILEAIKPPKQLHLGRNILRIDITVALQSHN